MSETTHRIWATTIILLYLSICFTAIIISYHWTHTNGWIIKFEMDNNTLEAIKSIDYKRSLNELIIYNQTRNLNDTVELLNNSKIFNYPFKSNGQPIGCYLMGDKTICN